MHCPLDLRSCFFILFFYFTVVEAKKQRGVSDPTQSLSVVNESDSRCPVHSVFDTTSPAVKRKFTSQQNFTLLSSDCFLGSLCSLKLCSDVFNSVS